MRRLSAKDVKVNILITGATGFIGRHLTAALSKNHSVRCLVRRTSDTSVLRNFSVEMVYGDLLAKDSLLPALHKIDLVYHLAGEVYSKRKGDYYKSNILATQNLLEASEKKGVRRIIYLSSIAVNKPLVNAELLTEESECSPITLYGKTKLEAERLIKEYNIPFVIARAPVVYGPSQPPVINKFFLNAVRKKKIFVIGDGKNLRSLCFVSNLTDGLISLAHSSNAVAKTFILSDEPPYTFNQIIQAISNVICQQIRTIYLPNILGDISWHLYNLMGNLFDIYFVELYGIKTMQLHLGCDIAKAKKEIAYKPLVSLEAGIKKTVEWIENSFVQEIL
jgi:nucleoside-diphosphate-sugar epimerase